MRNPTKDLSGAKFERLTVVERDHEPPRPGIHWRCLCDCGNAKSVSTTNLVLGRVKSCGCLNSENGRARGTTHGLSGTRLHTIWKGMRQRCANKNHSVFQHYGGKGIAVCEEWQDYAAFHAWAVSAGYKDGLTIERKDGTQNYCPSNCVWIPRVLQSRNRKNVYLRDDGRLWSDVAAENGIKQGTFATRLKLGWSVEEAAMRPLRGR